MNDTESGEKAERVAFVLARAMELSDELRHTVAELTDILRSDGVALPPVVGRIEDIGSD